MKQKVNPVETFLKKTRKTKTCWLWSGSKFTLSGYGVIYDNGKTRSVHRFSYELHKGPIPDGLCVCHTCDVRHCVNPDHLFVGTHKDNVWDMKNKGRANNVNGSKIGNSKLTEHQVRQIFLMYPKMNQYRLAKKFKVTQSAISRILNGENWKYIKHLTCVLHG